MRRFAFLLLPLVLAAVYQFTFDSNTEGWDTNRFCNPDHGDCSGYTLAWSSEHGGSLYISGDCPDCEPVWCRLFSVEGDGNLYISFDFRAVSGYSGSTVTNLHVDVFSARDWNGNFVTPWYPLWYPQESGKNACRVARYSPVLGGTTDTGWTHAEIVIPLTNKLVKKWKEIWICIGLHDAWAANWGQKVWIDNLYIDTDYQAPASALTKIVSPPPGEIAANQTTLEIVPLDIPSYEPYPATRKNAWYVLVKDGVASQVDRDENTPYTITCDASVCEILQRLYRGRWGYESSWPGTYELALYDYTVYYRSPYRFLFTFDSNAEGWDVNKFCCSQLGTPECREPYSSDICQKDFVAHDPSEHGGSLHFWNPGGLPSLNNSLMVCRKFPIDPDKNILIAFDYRATSNSTLSTVTNAHLRVFPAADINGNLMEPFDNPYGSIGDILNYEVVSGGTTDTGWQHTEIVVKPNESARKAGAVWICFGFHNNWTGGYTQDVWFDNILIDTAYTGDVNGFTKILYPPNGATQQGTVTVWAEDEYVMPNPPTSTIKFRYRPYCDGTWGSTTDRTEDGSYTVSCSGDLLLIQSLILDRSHYRGYSPQRTELVGKIGPTIRLEEIRHHPQPLSLLTDHFLTPAILTFRSPVTMIPDAPQHTMP